MARMMASLSAPRVSLLVLTLLSVPLLHCGDDSSTGGAGGAGASGGSGSTGGSGGMGGAGGTGGAAADPPFDLEPNTWNFVDFPEAQCMNGTPTGIAINAHASSQDVVIFLQGGNACFNALSCAVTANPNGYDASNFEEEREFLDDSPYFDRGNEANPLKDFSYAYVPYCTGDVHAGERADANVGGQMRQFHGYTNMGKYLERIVEEFPNAKRVVLAGVSAGGFGAAYNYDQVATAFGPDVKVTLIDDSGPPMSEEFIPQCLQEHMRETWGITETLPADCADCDDPVWIEPFISHVMTKYADRSLAIISSDSDETISNFWSFGENDCATLNGGFAAYPAGKYRQGLEDLRDRIAVEAGGKFGLYLVDGTEHVFLDNGFTVTVDGTKLEEWIGSAIAEDASFGNVSAD